MHLALNQVWLGTAVEVACCHYIWQKVESQEQETVLIRQPRLETLSIQTQEEQHINYEIVDNVTIKFSKPLKQSILIKFMPILKMRLTGFSQSTPRVGANEPNGGLSLKKSKDGEF